MWGWLDPSANADLMPITYLKGAGAAIGRGAEAFEAQQGQQAADAAEAAVQTGRWLSTLIANHCNNDVCFLVCTYMWT